jgi:hypothetical protein
MRRAEPVELLVSYKLRGGGGVMGREGKHTIVGLWCAGAFKGCHVERVSIEDSQKVLSAGY